MTTPHEELPWQCQPQEDRAPARASNLYVIATMPRTGSNLLASHLAQRGCFGSPYEYLLPEHRRHWIDRAGTADVLPFIKSARTTPNGTFGMRVQHDHIDELLRLEDPDALLQTRFVLLTRQDVVAQATSFWRAQQTKAWASYRTSSGEAHYDWQQIEALQRQIVQGDASWRAFTQALGVETLELTYEDLIEDIDATVQRLALYLDVEPLPRQVGSAPRPRKQSVPPNERWEARFVAETRNRLLARSYPVETAPYAPKMGQLQRFHRALGQPVPARWIEWARAHAPAPRRSGGDQDDSRRRGPGW